MSFFQSLFHSIRSMKQVRLNRNIITYLICVVIATILWFFNALNKDYTVEIPYPVKYINLPGGKHLVGKLPNEITLEVSAKGFALLGHKISTSFLPITFNVNTYSNHLLEKDNVFEYTLKTNDIKDRIGSQLSSKIKLLNISPEIIHFRFAPSVYKKIAVRPQVEYSLQRQYILNKITSVPDSVTVSGPSVIVDTLQAVPTEKIKLENLRKNVSKEADLKEIYGCQMSPDQVKVDVWVEQYTEAKKTLPVEVLNVPDSLTLRLFPDHVNITYNVGLSLYDKISNTDFRFTVDYRQTEKSSYLEVKADRLPEYIKDLTFSPQKVEYILEKK